MFGSQILEVAIGVIFVFILVSTICSTIREGIEALLKTRAAYLEHGIRELLADVQAKGLARSFYEHPLIYSLFTDEYKIGTQEKNPSIFANGNGLPSYIPSKNFAVAIMDLAARGTEISQASSDAKSPVLSLENVRKNITNLKNDRIQRALLTAIDSAQNDINKAQKNIEDWFDSAMDRVSGRYRRATHWVLFWIGLFVAVGMNINTISIADYLYHNDDKRAVIMKAAEAAAADSNFINNLSYEKAKQELSAVNLPIGWDNGWGALRPSVKGQFNLWNDVVGMLLGWLLTAFAVTMGAPFWFDLLNKFMVIRSTVKPHEKSPEESSEDRQTGSQNGPTTVIVQPATPANQAPDAGAVQPPAAVSPPPQDVDSDTDACDVGMSTSITPDEELPPAEGGVAS